MILCGISLKIFFVEIMADFFGFLVFGFTLGMKAKSGVTVLIVFFGVLVFRFPGVDIVS